jgi:F0F1-type ATP synthase assembly protein I
MDKRRQSPTNSNKELLRYAGLGTQLLVAIGLTLFAGLKADKWLHTSPLFTCALPLLILIGIFIKLVRETGKQKKDEPK